MRQILPHLENPALRTASREIPPEEISSPHIRGLIADMKALLAHERYGVALAAVQLGEPVRLFIVSGRALARDSRNAPDEPTQAGLPAQAGAQEGKDDAPSLPDQVYINPQMTKMSRGKKDKHEGCLSVRGYWGLVPRAEKATIVAYDESGTKFTRGASGFLAHVFQHEMDHLEGILYTDKASELFEEEREEKEEAAIRQA